MNSKQAYAALINNDLNWYVVSFSDGTRELRHRTALSAILECGHDPSEYGIDDFRQCWNGEELDENPF